jgi:hypothetical protein
MEQPSYLHAVQQLAVAGEQAGVSVDEMIQLLGSGSSLDSVVDLIMQRLDTPSAPTAKDEAPF